MAINRAPFNTLVDDDGTNTLGTIWNKGQIQYTILDPADTAIADAIYPARTETGTIHNWNLGLGGHALTRWAGAGDLAITGVAGGLSGQHWTLRNTGASVLYLAHLNGSSAALNQFRNLATSYHTPVGPGGWVSYTHDGVSWVMVSHEQGGWITPPYSSTNFGPAGYWFVEAGDVATYAFRLSGRSLTVSWYLQATSVSLSPTNIRVTIPGNFTAAKASLHPCVHDDAGAGNAGTFALVTGPGATTIDIYKAYGAGGFTNSTNTTRAFGTITFEVN